MNSKSTLLLLFLSCFIPVAMGGDRTICMESYSRGFYDPCLDVECEFQCSDGRKRIVVADPRDCQSYFVCLENRLVPQKCPEGELFNYILFKCLPQRDGYNKCQTPCENNYFLNFIQTTTPYTTTTTTFTATTATTTATIASTIVGAFSSTTGTAETSGDKLLIIERSSTPAETSQAMDEFMRTSDKSRNDIASSTAQLSAAGDIPSSTSGYTDECLTLKANQTGPDKGIALLCKWTCFPPNGRFQAHLTWSKDGYLLRNESFNSYLPSCGDDDVTSVEDGDISICKSSEKGAIFSRLDVKPTELYSGNYKCSAVVGGGERYSSNNVSLTLPIKMNMTEGQRYAIIGERVNFSCQILREDGGHLTSCMGGQFAWFAEGVDIWKERSMERRICGSSLQFLLEFDDYFGSKFRISCHWKNRAETIEVNAGASISVYTIDGKTCLPTYDDQNMFWNFTKANAFSQQKCSDTAEAFARKSCVLNAENEAVWFPTDRADCVDEQFLRVLEELKMVNEGRKVNNATHLSFLTNKLSDLTMEGNLSPRNLDETLQCLDLLKVIRTRYDVIYDDEIMNVMEIISNILGKSNIMSWVFLRKTKAYVATVIMRTVDFYLVTLNKRKTISERNLAIQEKEIRQENLDEVVKIEAPQMSPDSSLLPVDPSYDSISLNVNFLRSNFRPPHSQVSDFQSDYRAMVFVAFYTNLEEILPLNINDSFLASRVLVIKTSSAETPRMDGLINITFSHMGNISDNVSPSCVFWNFSIGENGDWSNHGCRVLSTNKSATTCTCNHMTNFALLMTIDQEVLVDNAVIRTISLIGCIVSIISLTLTLIILFVTWKRAKLSHHYSLLTNLCTALLIANIVFVAGIDKVQPRELCITVATLLHFFYLAAFFLMMAEGIQLLLYVVHVFHYQRKWEIITIITSAWVLALAVVVISLGVTGTEGYGTSKHCWLSSSQGLVWAFIGPALIIILGNLCILIVVLHRASTRKIQAEKNDIKNQMKRAVWNMVVISPLLGITWIFGVLAVSKSLVVFQYIFAVVNSLQGLFIFIFHGFCNQVRHRRADKKSREKSSKSGSGSKESKEHRQKGTLSDTAVSELDQQFNAQYEKTFANELHAPVEWRNKAASSNESVFMECSSISGSQRSESSQAESEK